MKRPITHQKWLEKSGKAQSIVADNSLALWQRAHKSIEAFGGLTLDDLQEKHRRNIESGFMSINAVLKNYPLNTFDDDKKSAISI